MWHRKWNMIAYREKELLNGRDRSKHVIINDIVIPLDEFIEQLDIPNEMAIYNVTTKQFYPNIGTAAEYVYKTKDTVHTVKGAYCGIGNSIANGCYYKDERWIRVAKSKQHNRWEGLTSEQRKHGPYGQKAKFNDFDEEW